ncbi:MAG: Cu(I)/Ag(I) efflux system membrane protein CusB [bacterium]|nr:MAG: Cu(I)/Ag(I) efflux system membrane protein CusB [bacterium]
MSVSRYGRHRQVDLRHSGGRHLLRLGVILLMMLPVAGGLLAMSGCSSRSKARIMYHCPMHPTYVSDRPADCPICNMRMVPIPGSDGAPVDTNTTPDAGSKTPGAPPPAGSLDDHAVVHIDPAMAATSGIVTTEVDYGKLTHSFTAVGDVAADEARVRSVEARTGGWVRFLHVAATGRHVSTGEPMLVIESPDMLAAQQEYVAAANALDRVGSGAAVDLRANLEALVASARGRLELFGLPKDAIDDLVRTRQPLARIPILAPISGTVTTKNVVEGDRVEPGMTLYTISDLSRIWIEARVFESDLPRIAIGQAALIRLGPSVDAATRALVVRLAVANDDARLRPGQYVDISFEESAETGLVAPASAILDTGIRKLAFVHRADDHYEPRVVTVGRASDGMVAVLSGLSPGEHVVSQAAFLVDSESRLAASLAKAMPAGHAHGGSGQ